MHGAAAVLVPFRSKMLLANDTEEGVGAPVVEVVISCVKADGAEICQEYGCVVGIGADDIVGNLALAVELEENLYDDAQQPARQTHELLHEGVGVVLNVGAAALVDLLKDGCVQGVDSVVSGVALVGKTLGGAVLKALLDDEGYGDVVALIYAVAGDEAVHARAQHEALDACGEYNVEVAVFILLKPCVFLCKKSVHRAQVDLLPDKSLVVGAVGQKITHKLIHCGDFVAQPIAVKTVAALFLSGFQCKSHLSA